MKTILITGLACLGLFLAPKPAGATCGLGVCIDARPTLGGGGSSGGRSSGGSRESREEPDVTHFRWGQQYETQGNLEAAAEEYIKAIRIDPNWPGYRGALAVVFLKQKNYADALQQYRYYFQLKDESDISAIAHNNMALALWGTGNFKEAEQQLKKAILKDPEYASAQDNLIQLVGQLRSGILDEGFKRAWGQINNPPQAEALFRQYLLVDPNNPGALNNLGVSLVRQDRWVAAEAAYREAIRNGEKTYAANNLATIGSWANRRAFQDLLAAREQSVAASKEVSIEAIKGKSIRCFDDSRGCMYSSDHAMEAAVLAPASAPRAAAPVPEKLRNDRGFAELQQAKEEQEKEYKQTYDALQAAWALKDSGKADRAAIDILIAEQKDKLTREKSAIRTTEIKIDKKYEDLGFVPPDH
jgi:Tfp pilus assembly protein PilF